MKIKRVYIASPLFNPKELEENLEIDKTLRQAEYDTFLPQRDGFLYTELIEEAQDMGYTFLEAEKIALNLINSLDTYEVCEKCDATVFNMNGRVPDEGAISEAAMTFAREHPLVIYKNDFRSLVGGNDNPLVTGLTGFKIVNNIPDIPKKLKQLETLTESQFAKTKRIAQELFKDYDPKNQNLTELIKSGYKYFL